MIVEMRTYKVVRDELSRFLEIFRQRSVPAHRELGIPILGPFLSIEDQDTFFFMRGFPDVAARESLRAQFYESAVWKGELERILMPMLEKYDVVVIDDADGIIQR